MTSSSFSLCSRVSTLLMTSTEGQPRVLIRAMSSASGAPMLGMGSTSSRTASTSATLSFTTFTI